MTPSVENTRKNPSTDPITIVGMASSKKYHEYYQKRYEAFLQHPTRVGWNGCAALFGASRLLMHKMYKALAVYFIFWSLMSFFSATYCCFPWKVVSEAGLVIAMGRFGNLALFKSLETKRKDGFPLQENYIYLHSMRTVVLFTVFYYILKLGLVTASTSPRNEWDFKAVWSFLNGNLRFLAAFVVWMNMYFSRLISHRLGFMINIELQHFLNAFLFMIGLTMCDMGSRNLGRCAGMAMAGFDFAIGLVFLGWHQFEKGKARLRARAVVTRKR